jgi:hypothetical protein
VLQELDQADLHRSDSAEPEPEVVSCQPSFSAVGDPVSEPDLDDTAVPPGMVLRYCGIERTFYFAEPTDPWCFCGHKIGGP